MISFEGHFNLGDISLFLLGAVFIDSEKCTGTVIFSALFSLLFANVSVVLCFGGVFWFVFFLFFWCLLLSF